MVAQTGCAYVAYRTYDCVYGALNTPPQHELLMNKWDQSR